METRRCVLVLRDGSFFLGQGFGSDREAFGELVFNTSMTGYQEALTDPSYAGQILTFAYPLVGNYGISDYAFESTMVHPEAVVVREWCERPVHRDATKNLSQFLQDYDVPAIAGLDTRAIVTRVRAAGVLPAALRNVEGDGAESLNEAVGRATRELESFDYSGIDFVQRVTRKGIESFGGEKYGHKVALVDCGVKMSMVGELVKRGCRVDVVPAHASAGEIMALEPDGIVYSNGPGDPALMTYAVESCRSLLGKVPVFGICLGHQVLGRAIGAKTYKLKFGHRGANQPVVDAEKGTTFITSQNHGFAVRDIPRNATAWLANLNDGSNEGLRIEDKRAFSVQFHPEAAPGPRDTTFLFDEFTGML